MRFLIFFFVGLLSFSGWAKDPMDFRRYGNEKASIQMYLFSSLSCPHCADFHQEILPDIKKLYLQTNKAGLTKVEVISNKNSLLAASLIRCQEASLGDEIESDLYQHQNRLFKSDKEFLSDYAEKYHIPAADFESCLQNRTLQQRIFGQQTALSNMYHVTKLPTLVVRSGDKELFLEGADKKKVLNSLSDFVKELESSK